MELHDALQQITAIRAQMARSEFFRGYRSLTVGFSGLLALAASATQPAFIASEYHNLDSFLGLWLSVAALCATLVGCELLTRALRAGPGLARAATVQAVAQFVPCLVAGAAFTAVIYFQAGHLAWLLPGTWAILFGLGTLASRQLLPPATAWAGIYYITCGFTCLWQAAPTATVAPWQMALCFGGGQLLAASVLYWTLERESES